MTKGKNDTMIVNLKTKQKQKERRNLINGHPVKPSGSSEPIDKAIRLKVISPPTFFHLHLSLPPLGGLLQPLAGHGILHLVGICLTL